MPADSEATNKINFAALTALLAAGCSEQVKVLCGLEKELPEPWRSEVATLRAGFDRELAKMTPTEQVPAASQAGWSIDSLVGAVNYVLSVQKNTTELLRRMAGDSQKQLAGLETKVEEAINDRVTKGELIPKAVLETKINEATSAVTARFQTLAARRGELVTAGLPIPADEILLAEPAVFTASRDEAVARLAALKTKGVTLTKDTADVIRDAVWAGKDRWDREVKLIDLALANRPPTTVPDPALGGASKPAGSKICPC